MSAQSREIIKMLICMDQFDALYLSARGNNQVADRESLAMSPAHVCQFACRLPGFVGNGDFRNNLFIFTQDSSFDIIPHA